MIKFIKRLFGTYDNVLTDDERLVGCCKLMARIFYQQSKNLGAVSRTFTVGDIYRKKDDENFGTIKVEWKLNND